MKLISVECPKCKGKININENTKSAKCQYCGNEFIMDDEVKKIKHIKVGEIDEEQEFINAKTNLKFKEYEKAYKIYLSLSERYVDNKEVWLGLLKASTENFNSKKYNINAKEYYEKYIILATPSEAEKCKIKYEKYINNFNEYDKRDAENEKIDNKKDSIYITLLGGIFGIHKFLKGKFLLGFIYLFTGGLFLVGWLIDSYIEVKGHPECRYKLYNSLAIYQILISLAYINYSFVGLLLLFISGMLTFEKISRSVWKSPTKYSKYVKIFLFIIGLIICFESVPEYINTWENDKYKFEIEHYEIKVYDKEDKKEDIYSYNVENNEDNEYTLLTEGNKYILKYNSETKKMCIMVDDTCSSELREEK